MGATADIHPPDPILQAYGLGKLDDVSSTSVSKHLEGCDSCQRRIAELSSDEFLDRVQQAQVMPDNATCAWSPSAGLSPEGISHPVVPPPPADTLPPELVDHPDYEIVRELGRGGMGVVYLANNRLMGRPEVLKVVGRHLVERPGVLDRFLREIRSAAKLQHANIVTAYSAMRLGSSVVLAMEYVEGLDLAKMVKTKGPLPIAHACYFIHQAALGLQHAHERGMVHRDIKPANLILARDGKKPIVKVLDFGLAKVTSEGQTDSSLTSEGQMLGTPDYIAPEQIRDAQSADVRADVYSLGCTLYYLLSGGPPFRGAHLWDLYQAHVSMEAGPLNLVRPEVPVELAAVVAKMMAKDPRRRFQTPGEVARALTPYFKPGQTQPVAADTEVSPLAPPVAPARTSHDRAALTEPATGSPAPIPARPEPAKTIPQRVAWESLIDVTATEEPLVAARAERAPKPATVEAPRRQPPWRSWPMAASVTILALSLVLWVATNNGRIKIVVEDGLPVEYEPKASGPNPERRAETSRPGQPGPERTGEPDAKTNRPTFAPAQFPAVDGRQIVPQRPAVGLAVKPPSSQGPITNSIGMELALIPPGTFLMGAAPDDPATEKVSRADLQHRVRITRPFFLSAYEVTQEQYQKIKGVNPSNFKNEVNLPVESVSWGDAVDYCNQLSVRENRGPYYKVTDIDVSIVGGDGYRLPTEAEWEYSCRAGAKTRFSWGNDEKDLAAHAWDAGNSAGRTHSVGTRLPNAFGLYDMNGNVSEWCWDWFDENYYSTSATDDPPGPPKGTLLITRGGSFRLLNPLLFTPSSRDVYHPKAISDAVGFRVARNVLPGTSEASVGSPTGGADAQIRAPRETPKSVIVVTSRFAKADDEGWRTVNEDDRGKATEFMRVNSDGRNFWLQARDLGNGKYFGWLAPAKFNGDQSDKFGRFLKYRIRTNGSNTADKDWYVRLRGGGKVIFVDQATVGRLDSNQWKTYGIKLDSSGGWKMRNDSGHAVVAVDQDIQYVLSNLKDLWIRGEYAFGIDTCSLDDVEFGVDPMNGKIASDANGYASKTTATGLVYRDVNQGTGGTPRTGQTCIVHYTGWLWVNNEKGQQFDSSRNGAPFSFLMGKGKVIKGWDEAISTMKKGGKRELLVPPNLAYGAKGSGRGAIPPNATLFYEVELLDVK